MQFTCHTGAGAVSVGWAWASNPEASPRVGVVVSLGSPVDSVVRTCLKCLSPELARHLADHLRVCLDFKWSPGQDEHRRLFMTTRNTSPESLSWTPKFLSLEGLSGPGLGSGVELMQSLLWTSCYPLFHSVSFFLSIWDWDITSIQELPHYHHGRVASLFDWTDGDRLENYHCYI